MAAADSRPHHRPGSAAARVRLIDRTETTGGPIRPGFGPLVWELFTPSQWPTPRVGSEHGGSGRDGLGPVENRSDPPAGQSWSTAIEATVAHACAHLAALPVSPHDPAGFPNCRGFVIGGPYVAALLLRPARLLDTLRHVQQATVATHQPARPTPAGWTITVVSNHLVLALTPPSTPAAAGSTDDTGDGPNHVEPLVAALIRSLASFSRLDPLSPRFDPFSVDVSGNGSVMATIGC